MTDEAELMAAVSAGDAQAFEVLVRRHLPAIEVYALRFVGDRSSAQDIAQEVMLRLWQRAGDYDATKARVTTWLYRVAVNAATDRRRRAAAHARAAEGWGDWEVNRRKAAAEDSAQVAWLHRAMAQLSDNLRDTLALVLDDLTHAEVAEILGVSEGTVSWRISEAKKALARIRTEEEST